MRVLNKTGELQPCCPLHIMQKKEELRQLREKNKCLFYIQLRSEILQKENDGDVDEYQVTQ